MGRTKGKTMCQPAPWKSTRNSSKNESELRDKNSTKSKMTNQAAQVDAGHETRSRKRKNEPMQSSANPKQGLKKKKGEKGVFSKEPMPGSSQQTVADPVQQGQANRAVAEFVEDDEVVHMSTENCNESYYESDQGEEEDMESECEGEVSFRNSQSQSQSESESMAESDMEPEEEARPEPVTDDPVAAKRKIKKLEAEMKIKFKRIQAIMVDQGICTEDEVETLAIPQAQRQCRSSTGTKHNINQNANVQVNDKRSNEYDNVSVRSEAMIYKQVVGKRSSSSSDEVIKILVANHLKLISIRLICCHIIL